MNLAHLPCDIIRNIFRLELEAMERMRLISPRWNALVDHLTNRKYLLPMINNFSWRFESAGKVFLDLEIPDRFRSFFGVDSWHKGRIHQANDECIASMALGRIEKGQEDRLKNRIARLFARCSSIKTLLIDMDDQIRRDIIRAIDGVSVDKLRFIGLRHFNLQTAHFIRDSIKAANVSHLELNFKVHYKNMQDLFDDFLSKAVLLVSKIDIIMIDRSNPRKIMIFNANALKLQNSKKYSASVNIRGVRSYDDHHFMVKISAVARADQ